MKENPYTEVLDKVYNRVEGVSNRIARNFKGVKPFNKEPIKTSALLESLDALSPYEMKVLIESYGAEEVNDFIREMEEIRRKNAKSS